MQNSDQRDFLQKTGGPPLTAEVGGGYMQNDPFASFFGGTLSSPTVHHFPPFHNVDFQPSEVCPRNFIIFDQTDKRSQIMYHPALAPKSCHPGLNTVSYWLQDSLKNNEVLNARRDNLSSLKEDLDDIDALLSLEEEEGTGEYEDEEEVSTARTCNYGSDLADSCSSKPRKSSRFCSSSSGKSTGSGSGSSYRERKRQKMRKMVKALRGIVPSSNNRMNAVTVIDEAVRYLKSLKDDVQRFGIGNLKS